MGTHTGHDSERAAMRRALYRIYLEATGLTGKKADNLDDMRRLLRMLGDLAHEAIRGEKAHRDLASALAETVGPAYGPVQHAKAARKIERDIERASRAAYTRDDCLCGEVE